MFAVTGFDQSLWAQQKVHANSIFVWICWKECNSARVIRTRLDRLKRVLASINKCTNCFSNWLRKKSLQLNPKCCFLFQLAKISSQRSSKKIFFTFYFIKSNFRHFKKKSINIFPCFFSALTSEEQSGCLKKEFQRRKSASFVCIARSTLQKIKIDLQFKLCHSASRIVVSRPTIEKPFKLWILNVSSRREMTCGTRRNQTMEIEIA